MAIYEDIFDRDNYGFLRLLKEAALFFLLDALRSVKFPGPH